MIVNLRPRKEQQMTKKSKDKDTVVSLNPTTKAVVEALESLKMRAIDGTLEHLVVGYMRTSELPSHGDMSVILYPGKNGMEFAGIAATLNNLVQEYISLTSYSAEVEAYVPKEDQEPDEDI